MMKLGDASIAISDTKTASEESSKNAENACHILSRDLLVAITRKSAGYSLTNSTQNSISTSAVEESVVDLTDMQSSTKPIT
jgi:hypothetical protein